MLQPCFLKVSILQLFIPILQPYINIPLAFKVWQHIQFNNEPLRCFAIFALFKFGPLRPVTVLSNFTN